MANNHVGIPKFIERGFSTRESTFKYDLIRDKNYLECIDTLGTENKYYEDDVENDILANGIEHEFTLFYNDYCRTTDVKLMKNILDENTKLIEQFFSFMFMRAKQTLNTINNLSIASKIFGDIDHSELLRIQFAIQTNPLKIIGEEYCFYPLINFSNQLFINNSLGFCFLINKEGERTFIILLNNRVGILVSNINEIKNTDCLFIEPNGEYKADRINKAICKLEKEYGNGFIFGSCKELVLPYIAYIKSIQ